MATKNRHKIVAIFVVFCFFVLNFFVEFPLFLNISCCLMASWHPQNSPPNEVIDIYIYIYIDARPLKFWDRICVFGSSYLMVWPPNPKGGFKLTTKLWLNRREIYKNRKRWERIEERCVRRERVFWGEPQMLKLVSWGCPPKTLASLTFPQLKHFFKNKVEHPQHFPSFKHFWAKCCLKQGEC